jgi:hypothetical protein
MVHCCVVISAYKRTMERTGDEGAYDSVCIHDGLKAVSDCYNGHIRP